MNARYLVIHHTAGNKFAKMEDEKAEHLKHGYVDIAYNGFIEWDGTFKKGRDWENPNIDQNAANQGLNHKSLSVALAGNFEIESPTIEQENKLIQVLATWCKRYKIPTENIIGHYQVKDIVNDPSVATLCPGKNLIKKLPEIRLKVKKYL